MDFNTLNILMYSFIETARGLYQYYNTISPARLQGAGQ
jgi:hypothetical protein